LILFVFVIVACCIGISYSKKIQKSLGAKFSHIGFSTVLGCIIVDIILSIGLIIYVVTNNNMGTLVGFAVVLNYLVLVMQILTIISAVCLLTGGILLLCKK